MKSLLVILFVYGPIRLIAQTADESVVNFTTPNASTLGLFTEIPVSQFTGTPSIAIPLYEIKEGTISLPISLQYHTGSVRVHSHPGWVGLGWSLSVGGVIRRQAFGQLDEFKGKPYLNNQELGFYATYHKLAGSESDWSSNARLQQLAMDYIPNTSTPRLEAMPDEFSFSFLGYSGKFFRTHAGEWKVISDIDIKLEFDPAIGEGFIQESGLRPQIIDRLNAVSLNSELVWSNRYFNKFTLVTPDGTRYEFGGPNATEYSVPYVAQQRSGPVPNAWYLTKIKSAAGVEVFLNYEPGNLIAQMTTKFYQRSTTRDLARSMFNLEVSCGGTSVENITETNFDGTVMFPVYLRSISFSSGEVFFDRSETTELRWPSNQALDADMFPFTIGYRVMPVYFEYPGIGNSWVGFGEQLKWHKLDNIRIYNYAHQTYPLIASFLFTYTADANERLKLLKLQKKTFDGKSSPPYLFGYNPLRLPSYSSNRSNDHWDFYNGYSPSDFLSGSGSTAIRAQKFFNAREPDKTGIYMKAETLETIRYPTGGKVYFEYEPHTYSKVVDRENPTLPVNALTKDKFAGGLRIKRINHYEKSSDLLPSLVREYFYVSDFKPFDDPTYMRSSGTLAGTPKYYWPNYTAKDIGGATFSYSVFSSGSVLPFGYNVEGSHIGYSQVVEVMRHPTGEGTNGYKIYEFSNFETDVWGNEHLDEVGFSPDPSRSIYSPHTSNDYRRGKILKEETYNNAGTLKQIVNYKYAVTENGYVRRVLQEPFDVCANVTASAQVCFVSAYKSYAHRYNLREKEVIYFDRPASFNTVENYEYTPQNFIRKVAHVASDTDIIETTFRYPLDFTSQTEFVSAEDDVSAVGKMIAKNIINLPIEKITTRNGAIESGTFTSYKVFSDNVFPHKVRKVETTKLLALGVSITGSTGLSTEEFNPANIYLSNGLYKMGSDEHYGMRPLVLDNYDLRGNVREVYEFGDVRKCYLMSYKNTKPVVEIVGASWSEVSNAGVDINGLGAAAPTDTFLRSVFTTLRASLPSAQITGYTYGAFGVTSMVDANGNTSFYEYDTLGRLILIKDHDGKVIESYNYRYSTENEN